jgi:hypothetical protein
MGFPFLDLRRRAWQTALGRRLGSWAQSWHPVQVGEVRVRTLPKSVDKA